MDACNEYSRTGAACFDAIIYFAQLKELANVGDYFCVFQINCNFEKRKK
jgi:hypothetical protein